MADTRQDGGGNPLVGVPPPEWNTTPGLGIIGTARL